MKKKSNIYIITECPYVWILVAIKELSSILKQEWFNIYFLLPNIEKNRYWETQKENENLLKEYWVIINIPLRRKYKYILSDIISLNKLLKWKENDIILSYTNYAWKITRILYFFWKIKNLYHIPSCIQTKRFYWFTKIIELIFEKILSNMTKYYLSCWPSESYILSKNFKVNQNKILLFPNFRSINIIENTKEYDFIYVWRMVKDKQVYKILNTFNILKKLNKILFVWDWYELEKLKNDYPNANFIWRIEHSKVFEYISKSKFFVSASIMEWMPYTLIEAMSYWLVPIVSNVEWHKDLIINNYNGLLFNNDLELTNIIFKLNLITDEYYNNLSKNAKITIEKLNDIWIKTIKEHFKNINY